MDWDKPDFKGTMRSRCSGVPGCKFQPYLLLISITHKQGQQPCRSCERVIPNHIPVEQHKRYLDRIFRKGVNI